MRPSGGRGPALLAPALALLLLPGCDGADDPERGTAEPAPVSSRRLQAPLPYTLRGRWPGHLQHITWRLTDREGALERAAFRGAIERALAAWSATGVVGFREAAPDARPDVSIGWLGPAPDGSGCPGFPAGQGVIALTGPARPGTWMRFNAGLSWTAGGSRDFGLYQAALHEIGHLLGLDESPDPDALMHPVHDRAHTRITRAEHAALATLYGPDAPGAGDLLVRAAGELRSVVRGVRGAPRLALLAGLGGAAAGLLLWPDAGPDAGTLMVVLLDAGGRVLRTVGPVPGLLATRHEVHAVQADGGPWLITLLPGERYRLQAFDALGVPAPAPLRPLVLGGAWADRDGDGVLEQRQGPLPFLDRGWGDLAEPGSHLAAAGLAIRRR